MTDIDLQKEVSQAEFLLGTITGGYKDVGVWLTIDGQDSASSKAFKILLTGKEPPLVGDRVLVIKLSGTYIVLGKVGYPGSWWKTKKLASDATLSTVTAKVNTILNVLYDTGIIREDTSE